MTKQRRKQWKPTTIVEGAMTVAGAANALQAAVVNDANADTMVAYLQLIEKRIAEFRAKWLVRRGVKK